VRTELEHQQQVDRTCTALRQLVRKRGAGIKLPTVQEMCVQFEVTRTQLEQALIPLERGGLIRRRRGSGIYGTERVEQTTIGVVFGGDIFSPSFSPFWSLLLQAVRRQAGSRGLVPRAYLDILEDGAGLDGHAQLIEDLQDRRLDGLMLLSPHYEFDEAAELRAYGMPLVCFGGRAATDWSVTFDWDLFLELTAQELSRRDCRRIGLLGPPEHRATLDTLLGRPGGPAPCIDDWSYETWACVIPGAGTRENCAHRLMQQTVEVQRANERQLNMQLQLETLLLSLTGKTMQSIGVR